MTQKKLKNSKPCCAGTLFKMLWLRQAKSWCYGAVFLGGIVLISACSYSSLRNSPYLMDARDSGFMHPLSVSDKKQCLVLGTGFSARPGVRWVQIRDTVRVVIDDAHLFIPHTLSISSEGHMTLARLQHLVQCYRISVIKVTGYWPRGTGSYNIKKAFAQQRAYAVLRLLSDHHVLGRLIYATQAVYDRSVGSINERSKVVITFKYKPLFKD